MLKSVSKNQVFNMCFSLKILSIILTVAQLVRASNYCDKSLCRKGSHIACGHEGNFDEQNCPSDATIVDIPETLQSFILNLHNEKRNFIASGAEQKHGAACRMATIQWDNELATLAALNVKQCKVKHDSCRNTANFKHSGQNLARTGYFEPLNIEERIEKCLELWYREVADSDMTYINEFYVDKLKPVVSHFTVMMAERNIRVGCAASTYSLKNKSYKSFLFACNYATNNMRRLPIYEVCSQPGSKCQSGRNPSYENLCAVSEAYDVSK